MDGRSQINPRAAKLMLMTCWGAVSWTELLTGGGVPCSDEPSLAPPPCRRLAGLGNADLARIGWANGGWVVSTYGQLAQRSVALLLAINLTGSIIVPACSATEN